MKSRAALQLENLALRHQIGVLQRSAKKGLSLNHADRLFWIGLSRMWGQWRSALKIVSPTPLLPGIGTHSGGSGPGKFGVVGPDGRRSQRRFAHLSAALIGRHTRKELASMSLDSFVPSDCKSIGYERTGNGEGQVVEIRRQRCLWVVSVQNDVVAHPGNGINALKTIELRPIWQFAVHSVAMLGTSNRSSKRRRAGRIHAAPAQASEVA